MLAAAMSPDPDLRKPRRLAAALLCLLAVIALPLALGACGEEEEAEAEVAEGEPLELGELSYNVLITRFLNPADVEDASYLIGQPPLEPGTDYLGVFLTIKNHSEETLPSATEYVIHDTLDTAYEPLPSESIYALPPGVDVPAEGVVPLPDTAPASGLNMASVLIFLVDEEISDNRPLEMEIGSDAGSGLVILDI